MKRPLRPGFQRVLRRELRQIAARPALAFLLGPYPLLLFVLLATVFWAGLPTSLPVAVVDLDRSQISRQITRMVDDTPELTVTAQLPTLAAAKQSLLAGKVYGILLIPEHAERDVLSGTAPEIVTFYNNQMLTVGGIVARATGTAIGTFSVGLSVQMRQARGQSTEDALIGVTPIPIQQSPLFNPALDYTQFLLATVMPTVLHIFICVSAVLCIARDRHSLGGMARLVRLGGTPIRALAGKLVPYGIAGMITLFCADAIIFGTFEAPFLGSLGLHLVYSVLFVATCLSLGALLALVAGDTVAALGLTGVLTAPAFGFAGISFPRFAMNGFSQAWGAMSPLTPYLHLRTDQVVRGADVAVSLPALAWLAALFFLYFGLALWLLARQAQGTGALVPQPAKVTA